MQKEIQKKAIRRLNIAQGQLKGLAKMIAQEKYCVDILTQLSAAKEALSGIENLLLHNHLHTHVLHQMRTGRANRAIAEILKVYRLAQKQ